MDYYKRVREHFREKAKDLSWIVPNYKPTKAYQDSIEYQLEKLKELNAKIDETQKRIERLEEEIKQKESVLNRFIKNN